MSNAITVIPAEPGWYSIYTHEGKHYGSRVIAWRCSSESDTPMESEGLSYLTAITTSHDGIVDSATMNSEGLIYLPDCKKAWIEVSDAELDAR
jgi:hypothetical protein